jgi:hypothetical protein
MEKELQILADFIKILLPAGIVLYAMYLTIKSFLNKEFEKKLIDIKIKNTDIVLPVRLQAYERMCLFLERISPHNLLIRVNDPAYSVGELHQILLREIREEYTHNMSQQVYMSDKAWAMVKKTMEDIVSVINASSANLSREARSIELAKVIFENLAQRSEDPTANALKFLKNEIRQVF